MDTKLLRHRLRSPCNRLLRYRQRRLLRIGKSRRLKTTITLTTTRSSTTTSTTSVDEQRRIGGALCKAHHRLGLGDTHEWRKTYHASRQSGKAAAGADAADRAAAVGRMALGAGEGQMDKAA